MIYFVKDVGLSAFDIWRAVTTVEIEMRFLPHVGVASTFGPLAFLDCSADWSAEWDAVYHAANACVRNCQVDSAVDSSVECAVNCSASSRDDFDIFVDAAFHASNPWISSLLPVLLGGLDNFYDARDGTGSIEFFQDGMVPCNVDGECSSEEVLVGRPCVLGAAAVLVERFDIEPF